jgi:SHS2 domain-containing protein
MKEYEFFEHTADAKFRAYGKTLEEQFKNAAFAMTSIIFDPKKIKSIIKKNIKIEGSYQKSLLYNWLEELLYFLDTEFFLLSNVEEIKIVGNKLTATISGDRAKNYKTTGDIKAVTYQQMEIDKNYVQVIVDI